MPSHTVRRGESLSQIAARYRTTVSALSRANGITNANNIAAGRTLRIPGATTRDSFETTSTTANTRARTRTSATTSTSTGGGTALQHRLAQAGRSVALSMGGYRSQGKCATGVNRAILNAMGFRNYGHANQIDNNLPRDRFREVHMSLEQALRTPGLVLTWERTSTRAGRIYGHTAITAGDGHTTYSDFIERNTTNSGRSGLRIFQPIR